MSKKYVIKCSTVNAGASGYARVRVKFDKYALLALVARMSGNSIQDTIDHLLDVAFENTEVELFDGRKVTLRALGGDK